MLPAYPIFVFIASDGFVYFSLIVFIFTLVFGAHDFSSPAEFQKSAACHRMPWNLPHFALNLMKLTIICGVHYIATLNPEHQLESIPELVSCSGLIIGANYKKILRLSYDVIITYDNRKSNLQ